MPRSFTETEKDSIRAKLISECEKSWSVHGYKKTSLDDLCRKAGISKGAFYLFYDTKELLFCDVLDEMQARDIEMIESAYAGTVTKADVVEIMKKTYRGYDEANIMTQRTTPDFAALLNRVSDEWKAQSIAKSKQYADKMLFGTGLKLKMSKEKAIGVFNALLAILMNKDSLGYDHYELFCTLLESVIDEIYE